MESLTFKQRGRKGMAYTDIEKSYSPESITANYGFEQVGLEGLKECALFRKFENGQHWLYHGELFHLVTNLYNFKGAVERISGSLGYYQNRVQLQSKLKTAVTQCAKANYLPQNCNIDVCPYFNECGLIQQGYRSQYDYLKNSRMNVIEYIGTKPKLRQSVQQVRENTQKSFESIITEISEVKKGLYVLKSPTGVGKTEILTSFYWSSLNKKVAFAMPTHKLKDEFISRCEEKGLYVWGKPQMVDFQNEVQQEIELLYLKKLYKQAKLLYLKELKKQHRR